MEPSETVKRTVEDPARVFAETITKEEQPIQELTERFLEAFVSGGGIYDVCGCGRKHVFTHGNDGNFDEGELEGYEEAAKLEPNRYFFHDYSSSSSGAVSEKYFVMDCPCLERRFGETARNIWRYRHLLIQFIRKENEARAVVVNRTKESLDTVPAELK